MPQQTKTISQPACQVISVVMTPPQPKPVPTGVDLPAKTVTKTGASTFGTALPPGAFQTDGIYQEWHPKVMALYCSDGRFTSAVEKLVEQLQRTGRLGKSHVTDGVDTLTIPGGPGCMDAWTAHANHSSAVRDSALFLIKNHGIQYVVLVAHAGCGHYKSRFPENTPDETEDRQVADLHSAAEFLTTAVPGLVVESFYAEVIDHKITFLPV